MITEGLVYILQRGTRRGTRGGGREGERGARRRQRKGGEDGRGGLPLTLHHGAGAHRPFKPRAAFAALSSSTHPSPSQKTLPRLSSVLYLTRLMIAPRSLLLGGRLLELVDGGAQRAVGLGLGRRRRVAVKVGHRRLGRALGELLAPRGRGKLGRDVCFCCGCVWWCLCLGGMFCCSSVSVVAGGGGEQRRGASLRAAGCPCLVADAAPNLGAPLPPLPPPILPPICLPLLPLCSRRRRRCHRNTEEKSGAALAAPHIHKGGG